MTDLEDEVDGAGWSGNNIHVRKVTIQTKTCDNLKRHQQLIHEGVKSQCRDVKASVWSWRYNEHLYMRDKNVFTVTTIHLVIPI